MVPSRLQDPVSARAAMSELFSGDSPAARLAKAFQDAGRDFYLVGGPVRDAFMGRTSRDLDFSTDARPEDTVQIVTRLTDKIWVHGIRYGTVGAQVAGVHVEITTFRTERYEPHSRNPDVSFVGDVTTDLSRRDFTVNAMAVRLPDLEPLDPFGGLLHLRQRLLATPISSEASFTDDPLRMLRAFRFASQLDFDIDAAALGAIAALRDEMSTISAERIRDELVKLIMGVAPGRALALADEAGLVATFLPEVSALKLEQDPVHRHKDVFAHTLAVLERTPRDEHDVSLRLAALLHDIGKPRTRRIGPDGVSFHHHEVVGAKMAKRRLQALRFPNETVDEVAELIRLHHRFHTYRLGWTDSAVRRYARDAGPLLGRLNSLVRADCTTRNPAKARRLADRMDELELRIRELSEQEELAKLRPELDGNQVMDHLGVGPGPVVGAALKHLLEVRLDEGLIGEEAAFRHLDEWAKMHLQDYPARPR
jgi:poly(A) polymerase